MSEWFDNPHFWETLEPFLFSQIRTPEEAQKEVAFVHRHLNLKPGDRVLDMPCGVGRHTLALARLGLHVTGVDITRAYLKKLGHQAKEEHLPVELIKEDMRHFLHPSQFEAAINLYSSFGYFSNPHHDEQVLKNFFASLKPGGRLILDLFGREALKRHFRERKDHHDNNTGAYLVQEATVNRRWDWIEQKWTYVYGQHQKTYTFGIRIYSADEIREMLHNVGFSEISLFGSFDASPYDEHAERLILLATKPKNR